MIHPLFYARYRRFAWFLFFCGSLYGMAFFALITRCFCIEVLPCPALPMRALQSVCTTIAPLVGFDVILWLFGFTAVCGFLSSLVVLGCGITFGILTALTAPLYRQISFWQCLCVLLLFVAQTAIVIWLMAQANSCAHTLRTTQNNANRKNAICRYTLSVLSVIPLQILAILSLRFAVSQ